jgi:ankyrin repeat protein
LSTTNMPGDSPFTEILKLLATFDDATQIISMVAGQQLNDGQLRELSLLAIAKGATHTLEQLINHRPTLLNSELIEDAAKHSFYTTLLLIKRGGQLSEPAIESLKGLVKNKKLVSILNDPKLSLIAKGIALTEQTAFTDLAAFVARIHTLATSNIAISRQDRATKDGTNIHGESILHLLAASGLIDELQFIITMGNNSHRKNTNGRSPLEVAAYYGHADAARALAKALPLAHKAIMCEAACTLALIKRSKPSVKIAVIAAILDALPHNHQILENLLQTSVLSLRYETFILLARYNEGKPHSKVDNSIVTALATTLLSSCPLDKRQARTALAIIADVEVDDPSNPGIGTVVTADADEPEVVITINTTAVYTALARNGASR